MFLLTSKKASKKRREKRHRKKALFSRKEREKKKKKKKKRKRKDKRAQPAQRRAVRPWRWFEFVCFRCGMPAAVVSFLALLEHWFVD
jgi:hypothetical protein